MIDGTLGNALKDKGQLDDGIIAYHQAIAFKPNFPEACCNLGNALKDKGQLDEAIAAYRQAIAFNPQLSDVHSNLIMALNYHPATTSKTIYEEARHWAQQHAEPLRGYIRPHANDRKPDRRLRIGYVSPDLCDHVVARFLLPLLSQHHHEQFELFAYADVRLPDAMTERLRQHADVWRSIVGMPDQAVAEIICGDRIDILMDLSGHSNQHHLLLFARKPAPVQATWLGYPGTTGLDTIDYRFTDIFLDPPSANDTYCTERLIRLPRTVSCYQPSLPGPDLVPPPAITSGRITFGCLNNFCKVSEPTLLIWGKLLMAMPGAQLLLYAQEGGHRKRVQQQLAQMSINPERIRFVGFGGPKYLSFYEQIDIVLDPFPYTGSTTTCDALWMGVPVVTLAGSSIASRMSMALLSNVGRTQWIAHSQEEYLAHALALARDLPRLVELRRTLRSELQQSPLMDASGFARDMESAYKTMWRTWCAKAPAAP